jgi:hypothetical protein
MLVFPRECNDRGIQAASPSIARRGAASNYVREYGNKDLPRLRCPKNGVVPHQFPNSLPLHPFKTRITDESNYNAAGCLT